MPTDASEPPLPSLGKPGNHQLPEVIAGNSVTAQSITESPVTLALTN